MADARAARLPLSTILPFSAPRLPLDALGVAVFVYLPPYFAGHLRVPMALVGATWMAVRLIDIPFDIGLAMAMDRTRTAVGRYRPWLVIGAPILMLALWRLFMAPVGMSGAYLLGWLLLMYLGNSIMGLAHAAWGAVIATHYDERSRLFGILSAVGVVGTMASLIVAVVARPLGKSDVWGVQAQGWLIIGLIPLTVAAAAIPTRERINPETTRAFALSDYLEVLRKPDLLRLFFAQVATTLGPGWMSAIYLFFFKDARGFSTADATLLLGVYILAGIPGALGTAALARRLSKHRTFMVSTTAFALGVCTIFVTPKANFPLAVPLMAWTGAAATGFDLMIRAMLADVGDEIRLTQGRERISLLYAVNGLAAKIAAAFAIGLTFPLLERLGYRAAEGAVNTPTAIHHLEMAFLIGPIVFMFLGGACVFGWRLDARRHGEIRAALEARDAALAAGAPPPFQPPETELAL